MPPKLATNSQASTALSNGIKGLATKALFTKKKKTVKKTAPVAAVPAAAPAVPTAY